ncbi:MAG: PD-(D/E)XK nuclease-like domain-containing protein [Candidatus Bathyarchaeia archaeon]
MSEKEYREHEALGFHDLCNLGKSYLHFLEGRKEKEAKDYQTFGTAAHLMALEPDRFKNQVVARPAFDRRTKDGKARAEAFDAQFKESLVVTEDEYGRLIAMRAMLSTSPEFSDIMSCVTHVESCAFLDFSSIKLKGRVDAAGVLPSGEPFVLEYKTTQDASFDNFKWDIGRYKYDLQLLHYASLGFGGIQNLGSCRLFIVAQEKEPPFDFTITEVLVTDELVASYYDLLRKAESNLELKTGYSKELNTYSHFRR